MSKPRTSRKKVKELDDTFFDIYLEFNKKKYNEDTFYKKFDLLHTIDKENEDDLLIRRKLCYRLYYDTNYNEIGCMILARCMIKKAKGFHYDPHIENIIQKILFNQEKK